ncbi:MAG: imidazolonepropionase, partial [Weeksellaceae bacterium]
MKIIGPFTQLLPMTNMPLKGALQDDNLPIIKNGGIVVDGGKVVETDTYTTLLEKYPKATLQTTNGNTVALPGFVDSHTHICWGGTRAMDFAMRNAGKTYMDIAREGGGIWSTVQ